MIPTPLAGRHAGNSVVAALVAVALAGLPCGASAGTAAVVPRLEYDATIPLAGLNFNIVTALAVDAAGNVWLAGTTTDHAFPITEDAIDDHFAAGEFDEGFVVKLGPQGDLLYATYLGGGNVDNVASIAVTGDGGVVVAGTTISDDFPTTPGAYQTALGGVASEDAFLVKLDADGQLVAATYFGGNGRDLYPRGRGGPTAAVAVASDGAVYLAGGTHSTDLPTTGGDQPQFGGGTQDAFLARFSAELDFVRCTYLGGDNNEGAYRVALDGADNVYLLGVAHRIFGAAWTFPVTAGAYQTAPSGDPLLFVAKYDAAGAKRYATFLGPDAGDSNLGQLDGDLAVDAAGNAYVAAATGSSTYPVSTNAFQSVQNGFGDFVVSVLDPDGAELLFSTYLGGSAAEQANGPSGVRIGIDGAGGVYVGGFTFANDYPRRNPLDNAMSGPVVAKLDTATGALLYSTVVPIGPDAIAVTDSAARTTAPATVAYIGGTRFAPMGIGAISIVESEGGGGCLGDCDGDGFARINELIIGVRIALGNAAIDVCSSFDGDGDGRVGINELIGGVRSSLQGC